MRNFLVALAVFVLVVVGLGMIVVRVFRSPAPTSVNEQVEGQKQFSDRTTKIRFTTDGAIVGFENHRAIRVTIDQTERKLEIIKGYDQEVIRSQSFPNNPEAFKRFLIALNSFGYDKQNTKLPEDERGVCPLGIRYIYEATYTNDKPLRSWSSNCGSGRLLANSSSIQQLIKNQIPDYGKLTSDVNLNKP